ncbi:MAG: VCBS repeat-containing protein [Deltaproteobacteria bacterium]|nr:VCBS repeat-containing protein [Deltaproteobacteria bacterium]
MSRPLPLAATLAATFAAALLLTACAGDKGADDGVLNDDSGGDGDDTSDSEEPVVLKGDGFGLYATTGKMTAWHNVDYVIDTTADASQTVGDATAFTALADFDGDGLEDLWQIPVGSASITVYMANGAGWTDPPDFEIVTDLSKTLSWFTGDFNGDALDDVGQINTNNGRLLVYPNAVGYFDPDAKVPSDAPFDLRAQLFTGDLDGDGADELGTVLDGVISVWDMDDGALVEPALFEVTAPGSVLAAVALDLDDDGYAELGIWTGSTLTLYPNQAGAGFDLNTPTSILFGQSGTPFAGGFN